MTSNWTEQKPSVAEQIAALEAFLRRSLPTRLRELYETRTAERLGLLPLATGLELGSHGATAPPAQPFADALARFASVLGHTLGHIEASALRPNDEVWPANLVVLQDVGCGTWIAVDLADPDLRIIEYEHLDATDNPEDAAVGRPLAYEHPVVPKEFRHRFTVVCDSLENWVRSKSTTTV